MESAAKAGLYPRKPRPVVVKSPSDQNSFLASDGYTSTLLDREVY